MILPAPEIHWFIYGPVVVLYTYFFLLLSLMATCCRSLNIIDAAEFVRKEKLHGPTSTFVGCSSYDT